MLKEIVFRFVIGGLVVAAFSSVSDLLRPKSFAGLFGAAPSVALATLGLTLVHDGVVYASLEARSMVAGAIAFLIYAWSVMYITFQYKPAAIRVTAMLLAIWFSAAFTMWLFWLK
jgi:hypothetical protein